MTPRYVLRWHKRTSWRRCGTELGAIDLGAELHCVHETCLAQSVKHKALNLVVVGSSHTVGVFLIHTFCLCHWFVFFCCPDFSFMSLICPSRFFLFLWPICLFVQVFFFVLFVFVTDLFFLLSRFFVYVAYLSVQIFLFLWLICLFVQVFFLFIRRAQRLCATVATSRQLSPLFAHLTCT
jgi:hypothetical protein